MAAKPKLLDQLREAVRTRHYSIRTEHAYVNWARRFILFHGTRHPIEMGEPEVGQFLTHLAVEGHVAASTQNQALSALLFLYREVLGRPLDEAIGPVVRADRPERLPVVLSRDEVRAVLDRLTGPHRLMAGLLYGAGLRLMECLRLRIKDVDFEQRHL
ncbi:phage integrase N-terminal SAM-like domain-containing protein, partial [Tautonia rosea]|uniref:phage integrase N-terminal SAM-like domain-containing protein n=1 Tax=Tautonia rosea TaxID=2728037 RepID=UPI0014736C17